jgi:hypothetical protein
MHRADKEAEGQSFVSTQIARHMFSILQLFVGGRPGKLQLGTRSQQLGSSTTDAEFSCLLDSRLE